MGDTNSNNRSNLQDLYPQPLNSGTRPMRYARKATVVPAAGGGANSDKNVDLGVVWRLGALFPVPFLILDLLYAPLVTSTDQANALVAAGTRAPQLFIALIVLYFLRRISIRKLDARYSAGPLMFWLSFFIFLPLSQILRSVIVPSLPQGILPSIWVIVLYGAVLSVVSGGVFVRIVTYLAGDSANTRRKAYRLLFMTYGVCIALVAIDITQRVFFS